jgi:hypothetical protein
MGNPLTGVTSVPYSIFGAWDDRDVAVVAKYDRAHNEVSCRYWRSVSAGLALGTSLSINLEKVESNVRVWVASLRWSLLPAVYQVLALRIQFYCFCDTSVREKAWRSHKRVAQAT